MPAQLTFWNWAASKFAYGEARISNFLLWQSAYAEYEFVDTLWPDFGAEEFSRLVSAYGTRDRRYGGVRA